MKPITFLLNEPWITLLFYESDDLICSLDVEFLCQESHKLKGSLKNNHTPNDHFNKLKISSRTHTNSLTTHTIHPIV